jgi:hypothetical protein
MKRRVSLVLILTVQSRFDGWSDFFFVQTALARKETGHHGWWQGGTSSLSYGAWKTTRFLLTTSQRRDATVLLTFGGGDGPQRVVDSDVLRLKFGISERCLWRGSGSYNQLGGRGRPWGSSSMRRVGVGGSGAAGRRRDLKLRLGFREL